MSSLLRPTFDGCNTSMRRRSNLLVEPLDLVSSPSTHPADECAVADEPSGSIPASPRTPPPLPDLSTLTRVHVPDHAPKVLVPRHADRAYQRCDTIDTLVASTPSPGSEKRSFIDSPTATGDEPVALERFAWRIASGYFAYFLCGWGDGVMATVLPHLMEDFNINFMTGSLFYAASTIGFLTGTLLLERIHKQLGRISRTNTHTSLFPLYPSLSKRTGVDAVVRFSPLQARLFAVIIAASLHGMFFVIMGTRGGFPAIFVAHSTAAFARSILTGTLNEFFAIVPKHLSYCFSLWGFGSVLAPLVCQALMAQDVPWHKFYLGTLIGSALNVAFLAVTFRPTRTEFAREKRDADRELHRSLSLSPTSTIHEGEVAGPLKSKAPNTLRLALSQPLQWVICAFSGVYFASETTSQGFMVSFLREIRHGNPKTVGFVTCGFFAGITLGRLIWGYLTPKLSAHQRRYFIAGCLCIALAMQIINWFVHSVPVNGTALAVIGLLFGPVFPASLNWANDMLPQEVRMVSMALISCSASLGCAILPFIAGIILNKKGAHTLPYINVTLTSIIALYWICLPTKRRTPVGQSGVGKV